MSAGHSARATPSNRSASTMMSPRAASPPTADTPPNTASVTASLPRLLSRNTSVTAAGNSSQLPQPSTSPPSASWAANFAGQQEHVHEHDADLDDGGQSRIVSGNSGPPTTGRASQASNEDAHSYDYECASPIEIHPSFSSNAAFPGTVKIIVEATTFWAHKEVLHFASPFFEAALSGHWSETGAGNRTSISSVITISQPPSVPGDQGGGGGGGGGTPRSSTFSASVRRTVTTATSEGSGSVSSLPISQEDHNTTTAATNNLNSTVSDDSSPDTDTDLDLFSVSDADVHSSDEGRQRRKREEQRFKSLKRLGGSAGSGSSLKGRDRRVPHPLRTAGLGARLTSKPAEAVVVLKEEKASTFHDFLKFIYPHLDCTIAWNNVEGLMNISKKLLVPSLQSACLNFLLTHAAGKPIKAMRIAELFEEEELYREASRFVLDNPGGRGEEELKTLSADTLLKLEKRRNWFLERLLKLGLSNIAAQYTCCPTCPDSAQCARAVEEKWRAGYQASFRFGPAQPSMVYRYLRLLEGVSPPLALTHLACQNHAKSWVATLFDRMFSLDTTAPLGPRVPGAASGPRRHFLYCSLKNEPPKRKTMAVGL
ncbi:hypothetical protein AURDEDRAFT_98249 [Auricularia subglabra TFB-10046 SS5]|nr:hypothetical protein AURDEDRAFT_98249 [Auricularia subglabra TFB-10046 SS5]